MQKPQTEKRGLRYLALYVCAAVRRPSGGSVRGGNDMKTDVVATRRAERRMNTGERGERARDRCPFFPSAG
jgi:hypothetical protein